MAYEARKAAQLIAHLIQLSGGQSLELLKVVKLVYLSDRESIARFGFPILDEQRYSLPHGPVNSSTLDRLNGAFVDQAEADTWSTYLTDRANNEIGLTGKSLSRDDFDELSDADIECADAVWQRFGQMDKWELRDWTHDNLPEWRDPAGGRRPITLLIMMRGIGLPNADELALANEQQTEIDRFFDVARVG